VADIRSTTMTDTKQHVLDTRARRAAKRMGLRAVRSRWRAHSIDNLGGFQILNDRNCIVGGVRFDMSAEDVIEYCRGAAAPIA
jgi:hypothetical protein